jgi:hypothetical protein
LARSLQRAKKESAILRSQLTRLHRSLRALGRAVVRGGLKDSGKIERRLGRLEERYPQDWSMLSAIEHRHGRLLWSWNRARWFSGAKVRAEPLMPKSVVGEKSCLRLCELSVERLAQESSEISRSFPVWRAFGVFRRLVASAFFTEGRLQIYVSHSQRVTLQETKTRRCRSSEQLTNQK